jgi:hypothetical protein
LASLMNAIIAAVIQFVRTADVCKVSHFWVILPNRKSWVRGIIILCCGHSLSLIHIVVFLVELVKASDLGRGGY